MTLDEWLAGGERVLLNGHKLFVRVDGDAGPWLTCLHGFPTSSWDYAPMAPLLPKRRLLFLDWLGFGDSDKPNRVYTIFEQADFLVELWRQRGITETAILAHDYGDTVTEELLARSMEGTLPVKLTSVTMLNGSIYGALNRPLLIQKLLQWPVVGAVLTRFVSEREFARNFRRIFGPAHPISDDDLHTHWRAITQHRGNLIYHRLVHHYGDQRRHGERWEHALETTPVPLRIVWGMFNPVSGAPIAQRLKERRKNADVVELDGVGHYPHSEVPDVVAGHVL